MKYIKKPVVIEAVQWFKHGDHPEVMSYKSGLLPPSFRCSSCDNIISHHGWIRTL